MTPFKLLFFWTSIPIYGLFAGFFSFSFNSNRAFCKKSKTLISYHVLQHLTWVCTVCLCRIKKMLGLYALTLIPLIFFVLKMLSAFCLCCICSNHFRLDFIMEANTMNPVAIQATYKHKQTRGTDDKSRDLPEKV